MSGPGIPGGSGTSDGVATPAPAVGGGPEYGPPTATTVRGAAMAAALLPVWTGALVADRLDLLAATGATGATHLLFAGVACTAIAAAVPQFVAVWSTTPLRWPRLASAAAPLVAAGTLGVSGGFVVGSAALTVAGGVPLASGLWALAAATTRTLTPCRPWDASERSVLAGTWSLAVGSVLGLLAGASRAGSTLPVAGAEYGPVVTAHATLMVLGGVLGVGYGGVFRLSSMLSGAPDEPWVERVTGAVAVVHPVAVVSLAGGRLVGDRVSAVAGAGGVVACAVVVGAVVGRRLWTGHATSPATRRYAGFAVALPLWGVVAGARWLADPLGRSGVLGGRVAEPLLWGAVAFLVIGSLYHVGPFLVWLERYADRLGFEPVPDVADLSDGRVARVDGAALAVGVAALAAAATASVTGTPGATWLGGVGTGALLIAAAGVCYNLGRVLREHAPWTAAELLSGGAPE